MPLPQPQRASARSRQYTSALTSSATSDLPSAITFPPRFAGEPKVRQDVSLELPLLYLRARLPSIPDPVQEVVPRWFPSAIFKSHDGAMRRLMRLHQVVRCCRI